MVFKVVRSKQVQADLALIFDHLMDVYNAIGDDIAVAFDRAAARVRAIEDDMEALAIAPYQGTLLPHLSAGMRSVTKNNAIFYFEIFEDSQEIQLFAVFFGGQDHRRHMIKRLLSADR